MPDLIAKIKAARKQSRVTFLAGVTGGVVLFAVVLPLVVFVNAVPYQVAPPAAAERASVSVTGGVGVALFGTAYLVGARASLHAAAPGYRSRTVAVDAADPTPVVIELTEAPLSVVVTTTPASADTRWRVDDAVVVTAAKFERELPAGLAAVTADHPFYQPQTVTVNVQPGGDLVRHLELTPVDGALDIRSQPAGASVSVGGESVGVTPVTVAVAGGAHRVTVAHAGYADITDEVAVTNADARVVRDYKLALPRASVTVAATPAGGVLRVDGVTATPPLSLTAGEHELRYAKVGYSPQSRVVTVSDAPLTVSFALAEEIGEVTVQSEPSADISVNGAPSGTTPQTFNLQAVAQKIILSRDGYRPASLTVTPSASAPLLIDERLQDEFAARLAEAAPTLTAAGGVTMKLFDPRRGGEFTMGSPRGERGRRANEFQRRVKLTKPFYVSVTEVTEAQFANFQPSANTTTQPARNLSWSAAAKFCNWMSAQDGLQPVYEFAGDRLAAADATADGYRLPTEAEWEWLARVAGRASPAKFVWGDDTTIPAGSGNLADESAKGAAARYIPRYNDTFAGVAPVASFAADAAGLYDMAGNVSEWAHDVHDLRPPDPDAVAVDPFGADDGGDGRVVKGASFRTASVTGLRASFREGLLRARDDVGFRVARYLYGKE